MNKNIKAIIFLIIISLPVAFQFIIEEYQNVTNDPTIPKEFYAILEIEKERLGIMFFITSSVIFGTCILFNILYLIEDLIDLLK